MSDAYSDTHIDEIREYACAIEARLDDSSCTLSELMEVNHRCIDAFTECDEKVTIVESDFEATIEAVLEQFNPV